MLPGIVGIAGFVSTEAVSAGDWTITIAAGETASNLTDYPVYLRLADMPPEFWAAVDSDGGNIRMKQSGSVIPFDVVSIDTGTDTGHLFFKAATLASGTDNVFALDLDGNGLLAPGDTNGRNAVWDAFDWVCMGESAATFIDRTGGANGVLASGTLGTNSVIALGGGGGLDCDLDEINFTGRPNRTVFTLGVTASPDTVPVSRNMAALTYRNEASGGTNNRVGVMIDDSATDGWDIWDHLNGFATTPPANALPSSGVASRNHAVYDGTTARHHYYNGALAHTASPVTQNTDWDTYSIGSEDTSRGETFDGKIAYAYARAEVLSAAYIAAEYSNLNAPTSFYAIT